ncbi:MAG: PD-(D/E)XK nuclease family protein [Solirubrobacteraceae bacterium]
MGLTLVLGPANSAKAGEVLGAYAAAARRGALLVVPTALDARHYARELAGDGVVLAAVLTFAGLVDEIARRTGAGGRVLSELQRERVLARVLVRADMRVLAQAAPTAGFLAAAGDLIAELQRSLVSPQRFSAGLRAWSAQDVRRAPYARELGWIYAGYIRELDRIGRVDRDLYAWRALDALRASPAAWARPAPAPVFLYGFDDLTAMERDAVETLARMAGAEVTVSLTYEPGREALAARAETVEELRPLADRILDLPALDEHYASASRAALHHLERGLFRSGGEVERIDPGAAIMLLESGGERAEAELVAQQVSELLSAGMPAAEITVVYRSRADAALLMRQVFAEYGIPLTADHAPPLAHTPLGRGLLGAARCALTAGASREDLLAYLRRPGVLRKPEAADGLEAAARRAGLRTAAQARQLLTWPLRELDELAAARDPGRALCRLAARLLAAPQHGAAAVLDGEQELDARALRTLAAAVEGLAELGLDPRGEGLVELLERLVVAPRAAAAASDGVLLADPLEIRARRFRAVFVCGLQEGAFPSQGSPEPFLPDERRRELALVGLRLRRREDPLAAERQLFYATVSRATERVVLSYRSSDEEGNVMAPSPFVADVAELLVPGWSQRRATRLLADVVWDAARAPTERERERALAAARADAVLGGPEHDPPRRLGADALRRVRHTRILSAGALETYGDCPVKWLVERELQPGPLAPEPEPLVRGSLIHELLERLLRRLDAPLAPATLERAQTLLDELLADLAASGAPALAAGSPEAVRRGALRAIEVDLRRYLAHGARSAAGWGTYGLELAFGFDGEHSLPALELGDGPEPVRLRGKIDRIDADRSGHAVVLDYKSGARRGDWPAARWSVDRRLQVAIYMLVVRELTELDPVAGLYQPLRGDDLRPRGAFLKGAEAPGELLATDGRSAQELDALLDDAAARAVALATALRAGELTPCPRTCSRDGCAHPTICRSQ